MFKKRINFVNICDANFIQLNQNNRSLFMYTRNLIKCDKDT